MARPLRIEFAGALYHVTSRGNQRQNIFLGEADRLMWLEIFGSVCKRFNWFCHGWCQMSNHYHIVVETVEGNLSAGMRQLNGVYTQKLNRKHQRVGHVYQGRYKAIIVEKEPYLIELSRYVVLNPVKAGLVTGPGDWKWSSYRAITGDVEVPEWLAVDWILSAFNKNREKAIAGYIDFVESGIDKGRIWDDLNGQIYLGSKPFIERIKKILDDRFVGTEIPRLQRRPLARPLAEYRDRYENAREGMAAAYATGDYSMKEIAACFDVHYSTVSRAVKQIESQNA